MKLSVYTLLLLSLCFIAADQYYPVAHQPIARLPWWHCDLDVDTDRDGTVEPLGPQDDRDEDLWTTDRGAIFLFNNDDDDSNGKVDAEDRNVNGAADLLDFAPVLLRAMPRLQPGCFGTLTVNAEAADRVRMFRSEGANWTPFDLSASGSIAAADLRQGLSFILEARDYAQTATGEPGQWDGEALLTFTLKNSAGAVLSRDAVRLRVAPFVLYSNLDAGERVVVTQKSQTQSFINELGPPVAAGGAVLEPIPASLGSYDIWAQDAMEFGYATLPGTGGPVHHDSVLRSPRGWALDNWTEDHCLGPDFGYVYKGWVRSGVDWIDWFGNLDCTPPLPGWPLGRIYTGYQGSTTMHPSVLAFLDAQRVQGPVLQIDTEWLVIGHVDEEICFVPSLVGSEYRMLMPNTDLALQILQDLQSAGKGSLQVFAGKSDQTTVNGILNSTSLVNYNQNLQATIDGVRQEMKTGLGIAEADIIDIPALFYLHSGRGLAYMPNMVNALVVGDQFITSDPFGPHDGGVDQFAAPVVQELTAIGLSVTFVDNWYYHELWGEVHCGTNAVRTPNSLPWWDVD